MLIFASRNIAAYVFTYALRMSHLAEHTSIRTRYALYRLDRSIRVIWQQRGRLAIPIDLLRRNLSPHPQLCYEVLICDEAALTVRYRDHMFISDIAACKPRGEIRYDLRAHHRRHVTTKCIIRERWILQTQRTDFSIRYQSKLYECLEAIAYTEYQPIMPVQEVHNGFLYTRIPEHRRDELA